MAFIHALLEGKSASDAYRAAYNCSGMSDRTIWSEASRLRANPKVSAWLRQVRRIGLDEARVTMEAYLAELIRGREIAYDLGQASAGVQAEHHRGKAMGLYEDRLPIMKDPSDAELVKAVGDCLGKETADAIGAALGIDRFSDKGILERPSDSSRSVAPELPAPVWSKTAARRRRTK